MGQQLLEIAESKYRRTDPTLWAETKERQKKAKALAPELAELFSWHGAALDRLSGLGKEHAKYYAWTAVPQGRDGLREAIVKDLASIRLKLEDAEQPKADVTKGQADMALQSPRQKKRRRRPPFQKKIPKMTPRQLEVVQIVGECKGNFAEAGRNESPAAETISDDSTLSVDKLAEVFKVPKEALRKRLDRCREKDFTCFIEVADRNPRDPRFLYKVGKVRSIVESMQASSETSGERPAKK